MLVTVLSALLAANAAVAHWPPTFVGCTTTAPSGTGSSADGSSLDACIKACSDQNSKYSYFDSAGASCICAETPLANSAVTKAVSSGSCPDSWTVTQNHAEFHYKTCGDKLSQDPEFVDVDETAKCFEQCNGKAAAVLYPAEGDSGKGWKCGCADDASPASEVTECTSSSYYIFGRSEETAPPPPTASGAARRRKRDEAAAAKAKVKRDLCLPSQRPCRIEGADGYECVDVSQDLEACGGCPHGDFLTGEVGGADCTKIPNIARRSGAAFVGCEAGVCRIEKCAAGFIPSLDKKECGPQNPRARR